MLKPTLKQKKEALRKCNAWFSEDWCRYFHEALGVREEFIWDKMREIIAALQRHRKVAVKAGNAVSKSFTAAGIANCFSDIYGPNCSVILTAPTSKHLEDVLFAEVKNQRINARIKYGGDVTSLDVTRKGSPKWIFTGLTVRPDNVIQQAASLQGYHNEFVLLIFDEASGVAPQIWAAAERLMTNERCYWLVIGNPPVSGLGEFVQCFEPDSGWHCITISVLDTPNYKTGREVVPGISGRLFADEQAKKYGVDSPRYMANVLGEIPFTTEGTVYGESVGLAMREGRIKDTAYNPNEEVYTFRDLGTMHTAVIYAQFHGDSIYLIDYYEDHTGAGIEAQITSQNAKLYHYCEHFTGWDVAKDAPNAKDMRGKYVLDIFEELGIRLQPIPKYSFLDGVQSVRDLFKHFVFDRVQCRDLITALRHYKIHKVERASIEGKPTYGTEEERSPFTHGAAALRCLALVYLYHRSKFTRLPGSTDEGLPMQHRAYDRLARPGAVDDFSDLAFEDQMAELYTR